MNDTEGLQEKLELTEEKLISEFNGLQLTVAQMAEKYDLPIATIRSKIKVLQKKQKIGYKNRLGEIVAPPGPNSGMSRKPAKKKPNTIVIKKEPSLAELIGQMPEIETGNVSTHHKELLIEVLHKIIC